MAQKFETFSLEKHQGVLSVRLNRPQVRNAFNALVIEELTQLFDGPVAEPDVRMVVLRGEGKSFCAGGDLNWMQSSPSEFSMRLSSINPSLHDPLMSIAWFTTVWM